MKRNEVPVVANAPAEIEWGSDIPAAMLRHVGIDYVALNPGASYRGLHDSLVNYLGNEAPKMLLCLHEDHVVSIAHGYAKATDRAMGAVLHSNVGLMHGLMGIFNAYCDRMPMMIVGATGPVASDLRRPWIDWIHTAKDQGALLRDYIKWDDEPRSPEALVEAFLRGSQLTHTEPRAPVYICLDAGLQEQKLEKPVELPRERYASAPPPSADSASIERLADLLMSAKAPLLLFGRGSRRQDDWDRRVRLAELVNAQVMTSIRERAVFPTDHSLHAVTPSNWVTPKGKEIVRGADLIVSLDWVDLNGFFQQVMRKTDRIEATIAHVSLDSHIHRGWSMDYFGLAPVDLPILANADRVVAQLLEFLEARSEAKAATKGTAEPKPIPDYTGRPGEEIAPRDVEIALAKLREDYPLTLAHVTIGWAGDVFAFRGPLDFLGHDGGAGLAAGPGLTVGAALALQDQDRIVVSVLGDGDFMQGCSALWTAAHYDIPALFIVSNNRSNFNDELHQEAVAKIRRRPVENRWIGQRIDDPVVDLAAIARAQGVAAEGPVSDHAGMEAAILRGIKHVQSGKPYFIDVHVAAGYASTPLSRGE
ncbi:thiamine pyrophosphate-dependent acetolactate synthase large subunit-like protein [Rhodoligotrophos appendicifer]|uniref:thiamine pyrophosphate-binding protein n=1 Tax=Rhodoligotrophos appendicifer TaxID=987056 RepID=UPI001180DE30|nr:thiamine pyrophosphate-dependent enzyme [Rhodoligotrophos appendicifer]